MCCLPEIFKRTNPAFTFFPFATSIENKEFVATINLFPENALLSRIRANDRTVLGELFARYRRLVTSHVKANGGNQADADDMLQEAIILLWQKVCSAEFELTSKLGTFLLGVVKNKWRAERRKRSRMVYDGLPADTPESGPTMLDQVISEEKSRAIQRAMTRLGSPCKELLTMFYFEQRDTRSIAKVLGFANANVVKTKKYQCKKRLGDILSSRLIKARETPE